MISDEYLAGTDRAAKRNHAEKLGSDKLDSGFRIMQQEAVTNLHRALPTVTHDYSALFFAPLNSETTVRPLTILLKAPARPVTVEIEFNQSRYLTS